MFPLGNTGVHQTDRTGLEGELTDLIDEFSEGRVQFAYVKVKDPNTGLPKNVLIAWCGEGVPERTKGYFTSHLSAVSKFLHVRLPLPSTDHDPRITNIENRSGLSCPNHGAFGRRFNT